MHIPDISRLHFFGVSPAYRLPIRVDCANALPLGPQGSLKRGKQVVIGMRKERITALSVRCAILFFCDHYSYAVSPHVKRALVGEPGLEPGTSVLSGLSRNTLCYERVSSSVVLDES